MLRLKQILLWLCEGVGRPESSCDRSISAAACLCTTLTSFALLQYQLVGVGDTPFIFRNVDFDVDSEGLGVVWAVLYWRYCIYEKVGDIPNCLQ